MCLIIEKKSMVFFTKLPAGLRIERHRSVEHAASRVDHLRRQAGDVARPNRRKLVEPFSF
jgi:hypothetical protein